MHLLTHNTLRNTAKGVTTGYPLGLRSLRTEVKERNFNVDFIRNILEIVNWEVLKVAASSVGFDDLPMELTPDLVADESFLYFIHKVLLEVHVMEGVLVCPETGREFPINNGIANMNLDESEI